MDSLATPCRSVATILVRKGRRAALAERLRQQFGIELPNGPRRTSAGNLALLATAPNAWLAMPEGGGPNFAASLRDTVRDLASVSDQSDAYVIFRLSGPRIRDTLAKVVPIDVHPQAFPPGAVAATLAGHISVTLWRLEDECDGSAAFEAAVARSFARDFQHFLMESENSCTPQAIFPTSAR